MDRGAADGGRVFCGTDGTAKGRLWIGVSDMEILNYRLDFARRGLFVQSVASLAYGKSHSTRS